MDLLFCLIRGALELAFSTCDFEWQTVLLRDGADLDQLNQDRGQAGSSPGFLLSASFSLSHKGSYASNLTKRRGCRDGLVVRSMYCGCRGPGFSSLPAPRLSSSGLPTTSASWSLLSSSNLNWHLLIPWNKENNNNNNKQDQRNVNKDVLSWLCFLASQSFLFHLLENSNICLNLLIFSVFSFS